MRIKIVVKPTAGGNKIEKEIETEFTIEEVKTALADDCSIPATEQRLIYKGQILKDERTVESYGACLSWYGWLEACPTAPTADSPALSCSCRDWARPCAALGAWQAHRQHSEVRQGSPPTHVP